MGRRIEEEGDDDCELRPFGEKTATDRNRNNRYMLARRAGLSHDEGLRKAERSVRFRVIVRDGKRIT